MRCSVKLKKLPSSNKYVGDYISTMEAESKPERVASILIRRNSIHSTNQPCDSKNDDGYTVWRRDYTTDYDDVQTEQRKSHKKKKSKRKRSRSLNEGRGSIKKLRKQQIYRLPPIQQLRVVVKPLNLSQLIVDPDVHIQFENELETDNEIYNSFEMNAHKHILMSTPKFNIESPVNLDEDRFNAIKYPEFYAIEENNLVNEEEVMDHENNSINEEEILDGHDDQNDVIEQNNSIVEEEILDGHHDDQDDVIHQNNSSNEEEVMNDSINQNVAYNQTNSITEEVVMNDHEPIDQEMEDVLMDDQDLIDQDELLKNEETGINCEPSLESRICEESIVISTLRFTPEPDSNDDETVVSTTHEIQEEIETEIVESMEHEIIEDNITSPTNELYQTETIETNKEIVDDDEYVKDSQEIISQTPESEHHLNVSGTSEEILDTNKILSESSDQAPENFLDRLNVSGTSDEIISSDTNTVIDTPKTVEQLCTIDRMLSKKPAKVLKANLCLDQISNSKIAIPLASSKNGEGKNGGDLLERNDEIHSDNTLILNDVKSSPTTTGEDEFLMEEEFLIDDDEIVITAANGPELNIHRSEGEQSCTSEEIPSPPFETVIPKIGEKVEVDLKKMKIRAVLPLHSNVDVPIESPPFDEVLDLKSFGTLENDSSISEMENVGKRVNDNFNEIDEEEENALSGNEPDLNVNIESSNLPENQLITSNQNDVTTTTLSSVQKKKNLVQRPYNRHIKINNKKRNSNSNSSGSDIPETIVSSTTITTNHLVAIANQVEFKGTNNSSTTYNLFCQLNHEDYTMKKRRGRPKGSKNKRKDIPPQPSTVRSNIFQYSPLSPPPPLKPVHRRQSVFYQHHEIASSSSAPRSMLFNNNPPYRPPYNASEESLNQINRNRSLPIQPFNRNHRINYRSPSCDSDEQPLIHLKHHHSNPISHHGYDRKHKKLKRHDSGSPPFSLEKQFGPEKDLLDATKTYMKVQEARTIFVPEDIDKLIQNQTSVDPSMKTLSPITTTYHRYDPGGGGGTGNHGDISNCANNILNNNSTSSLSDPITQSHQFVNYDTSSSPERILTQHEHNYSNDSFPHQLPQALLNTSSLDYLHLPYLLTAQQQFKTPLQFIHR